jgi:hypothetical protein
MSERAKAAYAAYGEVVGWKNFRGDPMPQFAELPEIIQQAWDGACEGALWHWLDHTFKAAVNNDEFVEKYGGWMIKVGVENGDSPVKCIRQAVASIVVELIAPNAVPRL